MTILENKSPLPLVWSETDMRLDKYDIGRDSNS